MRKYILIILNIRLWIIFNLSNYTLPIIHYKRINQDICNKVISVAKANEYKYYNTNLYKIIVCKKNNNYKKYKSQYTKINYMCFKTKNLLSTLIIINEILINNIFCYNYYKIHDIKYLVEKVKNIINVSNSNNIIENYLLSKKQVTYRYTKLSDNLSSDEENDDDKISLLKSIYSKEKTINIINYNKSKKSKGIFIDTNY